mgnify:CR=1 FL=1
MWFNIKKMLKKLIEKYGKQKLIKFLTEIHPHLNSNQKKRNDTFMNYLAIIKSILIIPK